MRFSKNYYTFANAKEGRVDETTRINLRDVAQLVAHYVRDVGVGRSSRLIPTKEKTPIKLVVQYDWCLFLHGCEQAFDYLTEGLAYHHTLSQH